MGGDGSRLPAGRRRGGRGMRGAATISKKLVGMCVCACICDVHGYDINVTW